MNQQNQKTTQLAPTNGNKPATQKAKVDVLKGIMNAQSVKEQFENALQKNAPKFIASVIDLYNSDTKLQLCEPKAVVMECLKAAVLNLPITKALGQAYVIPYNNKQPDGSYKHEPSFQIGYKGLIQLALRSGVYRTVNSGVVYEGELQRGSKLTGEINLDGKRTSDNIVGYFAYIETINGFKKALFMSVDEVIDHAMRFSKAMVDWSTGKPQAVTKEQLQALAQLPMNESSKKVGWLGNFHAMAIKTCMRNLLSKYGNLSVDTNMSLAVENDLGGEIRQIKAQEAIEVETVEVLDMGNAEYEEVEEQGANQEETEIQAGF